MNTNEVLEMIGMNVCPICGNLTEGDCCLETGMETGVVEFEEVI